MYEYGYEYVYIYVYETVYVYESVQLCMCMCVMPGGGYSHILSIRVCAAGKGMVLKPFNLEKGLVITENWSRIWFRLTGSLTKD